jgi:nucleolar protein 14
VCLYITIVALYRCGILQSLFQTLKNFVSLYGDLASFPEIFSPLLAVLQTMGQESLLPEKLENVRSDLARLIQTKLIEGERLRQPLRMRMKKPTPIKQFNPKFEEK